MNTDIICKEVIISNLTRRGKGVKHSPIRIITQVFEKDGTLIAEHDPSDAETFVARDLIHFAQWIESDQKGKTKLINEMAVERWLDSIYDKK